MNFEIKQSILLNNLNYVIKGISNKNIIPILNCIKFELNSDGLYMTSTDNESAIKTFIPNSDIEQVNNLGEIVISGKYIYEIIRKLPNVNVKIEEVIDNLDLDYEYEDLVKKIGTTNPDNTRILKITATHEDPVVAKDIANEMADVTAERVSYVMDTDKPNIVENAVVAKNPSSPSVLKNTVIGAMLGAILAMGVILVRYLMNDTIETEEDVRKYLDLHTLAAIPLVKGGK